jgi:H/ACA ribonucleoprotein complex non-core subunit NAF1
MVEAQVSVSAPAERQAIDGAAEAMPPVSAPDANHGAPVDRPVNDSPSHDSPLSSDSSDTSSSDDSDDSDGDIPLLDAAEQAKILMAEAVELADEEAPEAAVQFTKPDVVVTPDMVITELGVVEKVVELQVLVRANTSGSYRVLDTGSVLCLQNRTVLGSVFDIVGRVHEPAYTFGFPSEQELKESGITVGTPVYYVDAHSTYVFTQPLQLAKGTDALNVHGEGSEAELEFSDDELEAAHKRESKQSRQSMPRGGPVGNEGSVASPPTGPGRRNRGGRNKRQRLDPPRGNDPPRNNGPRADAMSIDNRDAGDYTEGYQPLRRPDNLTDLMQRGPQPGIERGPQPNMSRRQRGRRDKRDKRDRERRDVNRRGANQPGRFDRDTQTRGPGHEQRDGRNSRDGYHRGQQDQRGGRQGYGVDSGTVQNHQPFAPSAPASAPPAAQTDQASEMGRYRQGQYSSYSNSSSSNQSRPYAATGQYSQNYPVSQTAGYGQQSYQDARSSQASDYSGRSWQQNQSARAAEYTPSFNIGQTASSSHSAPAPSVPAPQQLASAFQFASPSALSIFNALQQAQAAGFNPLQAAQAQPQVQQPQVQQQRQQQQQQQQGGNPGAAHSQDIASILERFKAQGQQFRDSYG